MIRDPRRKGSPAERRLQVFTGRSSPYERRYVKVEVYGVYAQGTIQLRCRGYARSSPFGAGRGGRVRSSLGGKAEGSDASRM
jgi:hypothetical protein